MGRSRYKYYELQYFYFVSSSIVGGIPLFIYPPISEIITNALKYMQQENQVILRAFVIMPNHIHLIAEHEQLPDMLASFKSFTARSIINHLVKMNKNYFLSQLKSYKRIHHSESVYQVWQEGFHPKMLTTDKMIEQKMNYIHFNPVFAGFVDRPEEWRYSSARNYAGMNGIMKVRRFGE